jgi:heme/copper-type cytochrome/quinol oxidase subunit 2
MIQVGVLSLIIIACTPINLRTKKPTGAPSTRGNLHLLYLGILNPRIIVPGLQIPTSEGVFIALRVQLSLTHRYFRNLLY